MHSIRPPGLRQNHFFSEPLKKQIQKSSHAIKIHYLENEPIANKNEIWKSRRERRAYKHNVQNKDKTVKPTQQLSKCKNAAKAKSK